MVGGAAAGAGARCYEGKAPNRCGGARARAKAFLDEMLNMFQELGEVHGICI